jgi:DNA-damage-inducible protein J
VAQYAYRRIVDMKTTNYSIRLDPDIKAKAEKTYAELGLNLSEAINVFLHMSIKQYGFPFEVVSPKPNEMLLASFEEADAILANPKRTGYTTVAALNAAMDAEDAAEA